MNQKQIAKLSGKSVDDVHVAYATGNFDDLWYGVSCKKKDSDRRIEELEHALRRVLPLFESYVEDMGVCDHAVDICICEDMAALEELKRVLGKE